MVNRKDPGAMVPMASGDTFVVGNQLCFEWVEGGVSKTITTNTKIIGKYWSLTLEGIWYFETPFFLVLFFSVGDGGGWGGGGR